MSLDFSGERIIPGKVEHHLEVEHIARYMSIEGHLRNGGNKILDAGCGSGYGSAMLAKAGNFVQGIDVSCDAISYAHEKYSSENLLFSQVDCNHELPFPSNNFDVVISFEVIEHLTNYRLFLQELFRVLKPNGVCYLSTPNKRVYTDARNYHNPYHVHEFYPQELSNLLLDYCENVKLLGQVYLRCIYIGESRVDKTGITNAFWLLDENDPVTSDEDFIQEADYLLAVCKKSSSGAMEIGNTMLIASSVNKSNG